MYRADVLCSVGDANNVFMGSWDMVFDRTATEYYALVSGETNSCDEISC